MPPELRVVPMPPPDRVWSDSEPTQAVRRHPPRPVTYEEEESGVGEDVIPVDEFGEPTEACDEDDLFPFERDPRIGTFLGAYAVMRVLAAGGMGIVYLGRHLRIERKVAIKLPRSHVLRDEQMRRRFQAEAMAAVQIAHPGVVNVFDFGVAPDGTPYLVMELLEGGPLAERMNGSPMPIDFTTRLGARVADTLAAAHEAGVIHRDLKPENVFLQRRRHRPDRVNIKVLDFGFAKVEGLARDIAPMTQHGLVLGTPCYMSPEQCLAFTEVGPRSDIYSLGCILYEMAAGQLPFSGTLQEVKLALQYRPVVSPRWHNREIPAALDDLIMRMLAKYPDDRPASMVEVARELEAMDPRRRGQRENRR
ncbi:MAG TPA: serine/threonine-protein kinase [Kofleriaceae bacterium]|nr:serine/threonine-protein kinase [Kofleriaceae bacterium]